jgi:hypothetical protein
VYLYTTIVLRLPWSCKCTKINWDQKPIDRLVLLKEYFGPKSSQMYRYLSTVRFQSQ